MERRSIIIISWMQLYYGNSFIISCRLKACQICKQHMQQLLRERRFEIECNHRRACKGLCRRDVEVMWAAMGFSDCDATPLGGIGFDYKNSRVNIWGKVFEAYRSLQFFTQHRNQVCIIAGSQ